MELTNIFEIVANGAIVVTALVGVLTLVLSLVKEIKLSKVIPFRRKLDYIDRFGDFIKNSGTGVLTIKGVKFYYDDKEVKVDSLVDLYAMLLNGKYGTLCCKTYLHTSEIINRPLKSQQEFRLVEINPIDNKNLFEDLIVIRKKIKIELTYKSVYSLKKTITL